ncbi:hypothetical protein [Saccharothrix violaceirubra]|uniref:Ribosomal protein S27AE n=1 Tax=Saccharothrix violaceirubra TaxID=413306 RepID=A0A7W7SZN2_9PSEU|nr:hypothetical protein [Saccharothrix violaceirubra]MBB4963760.1 ribosomal protein S27AE [Saccharothrix violaceirubra]
MSSVPDGIRQPVRHDLTTTELGARLHVVERPVFPCPRCGRAGWLAVHLHGVRRPCGHTRSLPPLTPTPAHHRHHRGAA